MLFAKGVQDGHDIVENKGSAVIEKVSGHMKEKQNYCDDVHQ